jgi:hypothetical protein
LSQTSLLLEYREWKCHTKELFQRTFESTGHEVLFSDFLSDEDASSTVASDRHEILGPMVDDFRRAFPDISFELRLDRRVINAQAIALAGKRAVLLYGGLALHPRLGEDALTFCLLHEVGHHLANGNRLSCDVSLACECAADYWASTEGVKVLRKISGRSFKMAKAMDDLSHVIRMQQGEDALDFREIEILPCWSRYFSLRKQALINQPNSQPCGECCY